MERRSRSIQVEESEDVDPERVYDTRVSADLEGFFVGAAGQPVLLPRPSLGTSAK